MNLVSGGTGNVGSPHQMRVVLTVEDFDGALSYYRDGLGMRESPAVAGRGGARIAILEAGRATLEIADQAQARFIDEVEADGSPGTAVRLAFEVNDAAAAAAALGGAGAGLIAPLVSTPWTSASARLDGPAGVQVTVFQPLDDDSRAGGHDEDVDDVVGATVAALADEPGVLARTVRMAQRHGASGQLPFAALVARHGVVIGTGVNTALTDLDPSAHGEVVAIRDAARRTGSIDLAEAVVYSSCEPCAICRTVAAAAGVREIVYAAGKELIPPAMDPDPETTGSLIDPETTGRLIDAVTALLPGIARRGTTELSDEELSAPFEVYLRAVAA
jgi:tRNA(Arg) A34 adenosine deaminase TadA/uncharacterized glyoxalase superfamily protein PhnB